MALGGLTLIHPQKSEWKLDSLQEELRQFYYSKILPTNVNGSPFTHGVVPSSNKRDQTVW